VGSLIAALFNPLQASGLHLDICQHRAATSVHAAVYGVIVDVVDAVSNPRLGYRPEPFSVEGERGKEVWG
jgi:hypothetical protein